MFDRRYFIVAQSSHGTTLLSKRRNEHPAIVSLGIHTQAIGWRRSVVAVSRRAAAASGARSEDIDADRYRSCPHFLPNYPRIVGGSGDRILYNCSRRAC